MGIRTVIKKTIKLFKHEIKTPVYIPLLQGHILSGKNILVTGGAGGIGVAIANQAISNGATVILAGRNEEKLISACQRLSSNFSIKAKIYHIVLDICDTKSIKSKIQEALDLLPDKRIDILVNNAGVSYGNIIGVTTESDYDRTLEVNLKGTYFMAQEFSNYLTENNIQGNILNISSTSGNRPAVTPYMLSKWGITGLTEGLAKKLIKYNIVVNGIAPGPTTTTMLGKDGSDLSYDRSPAQRYVDPIEVANLAVFLVSDMGRMIVGETIYISGGCGTLTLDDIEY